MTPYHAAALAFGHGLRLLPRRLRWDAMLRASRLAAPLVPRADRGGEPGLGIDGYREIALWRLMMAAAEAGLGYDPVVEHQGREHVDSALDGGRAILLAAPHSLLGYVLLRLLRDRGRAPVAMAATPVVPIFGTAEMARVIPFSEVSLAEAVRTLRSGEILCAMIDRPGPEPKAIAMPTAIGPIYISDALLRFALRERAAILFCTARIVDGHVRVSWSAPAETASGDEVGRDFASFVAARIAEGHGRDGPRSRAFSREAPATPVRTGGAAPADRNGRGSCMQHNC